MAWPTIASAAIAALFVAALALPSRTAAPVVAPAFAMLRAQGVEIESSASNGLAEIRAVAHGSPAARLGLRPGDLLLTFDAGSAPSGMLNISVQRGDSSRYFALPRLRTVGNGAGAT